MTDVQHRRENRAPTTSMVGVLSRLILVVALAALIFLTVTDGRAQAQAFTDVTGNEYFASALQTLSDQGVVQGRPDGSFGPHDQVTRGQLAALLARILGLPQSLGSPFIDLTSAHWSYGYVAALYWAGLAAGDGSNRFLPDMRVSRQQAATFIMGSLAYRLEQSPQWGVSLSGPGEPTAPWLAVFRDRPTIATEHAPAVAEAYRLGVMEGSVGGWLYPSLSLTRAQMVVLLDRAFYRRLAPKTEYPPEVAVEGYAKQSSGSRGVLVQILEARLAALSYDCGSQDGVYDHRTRDAVMAFEKVERLARDGVAGKEVWERLFSTGTPAPRLDRPGRRAEVDLRRQVLFMIENNVVFKTVHVSTGKLGTPTGRGVVYHKDPGWVHVPVGWMYSPSYIMPHIAIHGSKSVPPYPASHGCVRTPVWATDQLYRELSLGLVVDVYY